MSFVVADPHLEERLVALGGRQPAPVTKTTMARAILLRAVEAAEQTEDPLGWMPTKHEVATKT